MSPEAAALVERIERDLAALRAILAPRVIDEPDPDPVPEALIEPCKIADQLGISEAYVRKLCSRGMKLGEPGVERRGGRWFATVDAIERLRDG